MRYLIRIVYLFLVLILFFLFSCDYNDSIYYYPSNANPTDPSDKTIEYSGNVYSADSLIPLDSIRIQIVSDYYYNDTTTIYSKNGSYFSNILSYDGEKFSIFLHDIDSVYSDTTYYIRIANRDFVLGKFNKDFYMN